MNVSRFVIDSLPPHEAGRVRDFVSQYYAMKPLDIYNVSDEDIRVFIRYIRVSELPFDIIDLLKKGERA